MQTGVLGEIIEAEEGEISVTLNPRLPGYCEFTPVTAEILVKRTTILSLLIGQAHKLVIIPSVSQNS